MKRIDTKKKYRIEDKGKFATFIIGVFLIGVFVGLMIDIVKYPECYNTVAKYHLKCDLAAGNEKAIEYYENTYLKNDRVLFE